MTRDPRLLARECEIELRTASEGCFHESSSELRLAWSESSATLTIARRELPSTRAEVHSIAERIVHAAERPEISTGGASTTGYRATLRRRFRESSEERWTTGEASFESRDVPRRDLEAILAQRPTLASRVPVGVYARAMGLYDLVESIERTDGTPARSDGRPNRSAAPTGADWPLLPSRLSILQTSCSNSGNAIANEVPRCRNDHRRRFEPDPTELTLRSPTTRGRG